MILKARHVLAASAVMLGATPGWAAGARSNAPPRDWDISLGAAVFAAPTYEGSDRYRVRPLPFASISWRDTIRFGQDGLTAQWKLGGLRLGGGVAFDGGRKDHSTGGIFESGDDRLKGLGTINFAVGVTGFADYRLGFLNLHAAATKFTGGQNHGLRATFGVSTPFRLGSRLTVIPDVRATWADDNSMQTFFGVTPQQALASRFAVFHAGSGLRDVSAGVGLIYSLNRHWFAGINANATRLLGDAAKSPITFADENTKVIGTLGYRF